MTPRPSTRPGSGSRRHRTVLRWVAGLAMLAGLGMLGRPAVFLVVEHDAFVTPPAGRLRPAPLGAPSHRMTFASGDRLLRASFVAPWAAWLLPDLWNNERRLADVALPLLIVHGRDDEGVPLAHALRLCAAARGPRRLVVLDDLPHDAPLDPTASTAFWDAVVDAVTSGRLIDPATAPSSCRLRDR